MLNSSGKVPALKNMCLENTRCMCCTRSNNICLCCINMCRYSCGCKSQDSSGEMWFGLHTSSPAGSHPAWRSPSGTLTKDTRQCGHPSAVCLEQSTGTPCSLCCCMRDALHMDLQWSCDVASNLDLTALVDPWLPSEGPGSALPSGHPACLFLHQTLTAGAAKGRREKKEKGMERR